MILDEVFKIIDRLTPEQKQQVKHYIDQRHDALRSEIDTLLASARPTPLKAGTMDIDQLLRSTHEMWDQLDEREIEALIQAMNAEYVESDRTLDE